MRAYVDANVLVRLYLNFDGSNEARDLTHGVEARKCWPLPATTLLCLEVNNALQRMAYEHRGSGQWRISPEGAAAARGDFEEDLESGTVLRPITVSLEEIAPQFDALVTRHTAKHGFRTYDLLHVASALHLGCDTFWSFDAKALKLARLEGLKTNR